MKETLTTDQLMRKMESQPINVAFVEKLLIILITSTSLGNRLLDYDLWRSPCLVNTPPS